MTISDSVNCEEEQLQASSQFVESLLVIDYCVNTSIAIVLKPRLIVVVTY